MSNDEKEFKEIPFVRLVSNSVDAKGNGIKRKIINFNQLKSIPASIFGGRIGIIPWYPIKISVINTQTGREENVTTNMMILGLTNIFYLSDFGGGFKKFEDKKQTISLTPYEGLKRELEEEVPMWKKYLISTLHKTSPLILVTEEYSNHNISYVDILLFLSIDIDKLDEFNPIVNMNENPDEIIAIKYKLQTVFEYLIDNTPTVGSYGLRYYHKFRKDIEKNKEISEHIEAYFRNNNPVNHYNKEDTLLLLNTFNKDLYENTRISKKANTAYKYRLHKLKENYRNFLFKHPRKSYKTLQYNVSTNNNSNSTTHKNKYKSKTKKKSQQLNNNNTSKRRNRNNTHRERSRSRSRNNKKLKNEIKK